MGVGRDVSFGGNCEVHLHVYATRACTVAIYDSYDNCIDLSEAQARDLLRVLERELPRRKAVNTEEENSNTGSVAR